MKTIKAYEPTQFVHLRSQSEKMTTNLLCICETGTDSSLDTSSSIGAEDNYKIHRLSSLTLRLPAAEI